MKYMIELPHTTEECLKALDETKAGARDLLPLIDWGCRVGYHTGWVLVDAASDYEARSRITSSFLRSTAKVIQVSKFTEKEIDSFHQ